MTNPDFWPSDGLTLEKFVERVWQYGVKTWRDLPWRYLDDPYGVWVSEVMLQQTQVSRVLTYWTRFMQSLPTIDALAAADVATVQRLCMGLGYYQRFVRMKYCADFIATEMDGIIPRSYKALLALPGIGTATAAGIRVFAYNEPEIYLETNVRTVFIHELFPGQTQIRDATLRPLVEATCPADNPRDWYYALLDYGAYLKSQHPNPSRASAHYHKQSKFEGSWRQKRAWLLRCALEGFVEHRQAYDELCDFDHQHEREPLTWQEFDQLENQLAEEGLISKDDRGIWV